MRAQETGAAHARGGQDCAGNGLGERAPTRVLLSSPGGAPAAPAPSAWLECSGSIRQPSASGMQAAAIPVNGHAANRLQLFIGCLDSSNPLQPLHTVHEQAGEIAGTALDHTCHLEMSPGQQPAPTCRCCLFTAGKDLRKLPLSLLPPPPLLQEPRSAARCLVALAGMFGPVLILHADWVWRWCGRGRRSARSARNLSRSGTSGCQEVGWSRITSAAAACRGAM